MKLIIVIAFISLSAISVNSKICESKTECASDECCATVEGKGNECMKYLESGELCDTHAIIKPNCGCRTPLHCTEPTVHTGQHTCQKVEVNTNTCESKADCGEGECCGTVEGAGNECLKYLEAAQQCAHHATHPNCGCKAGLHCTEPTIQSGQTHFTCQKVAVHSKICESLTDCGADECCGTVESGGNECLKYLETGQQCAHHAEHPNCGCKTGLHCVEPTGQTKFTCQTS